VQRQAQFQDFVEDPVRYFPLRGFRQRDRVPGAKRQRHLVSAADVILVMTEEQRRMLLENFPEAAGKHVLTLRELAGESGDIEDPATRDEDFFRHTRDEITRCLEQGLERLIADVEPV